MIEKAGLKIIRVNSTIFQAPTEKPLHYEDPRKGHHEEAGFVAIKLGKIGSRHRGKNRRVNCC
jgi:hypothetical protein